eukprot:gene23716-40702_t
MVDTPEDSLQRQRMATMVVIAQGYCAPITDNTYAVTSGKWSDTIGRKPLVYLSCGVMCL